jgi:hypothetical protein
MNDTRLALSDVRGPLTDLLTKIDGENGGVWLRELNKFLRKEKTWENWPPKIFITIDIGTYKDLETLYQALTGSGILVGNVALTLFDKMRLCKSRKSLDLVVVSVKELGFSSGASIEHILETGNNFGLDLCPAEVGPQLLLQCSDLPAGEELLIAMKPVSNREKDGCVFGCDYYGGDDRRLKAKHTIRDFGPSILFVFVKRQKAL